MPLPLYSFSFTCPADSRSIRTITKKENLHTFRTHSFIHARRDFKSTNYLKLFSYTLLLLRLLSVCFSEFSRSFSFRFVSFLFVEQICLVNRMTDGDDDWFCTNTLKWIVYLLVLSLLLMFYASSCLLLLLVLSKYVYYVS